MDINELTIGQAKELVSTFGNCSEKIEKLSMRRHKFTVGNAYFIRSVTHHYLGKVIEICDLCIVMKACVWVADDGRFHKLMQGEWSQSSEREPYGEEKEVQIFFGGMLDAVLWDYEIPTTVK